MPASASWNLLFCDVGRMHVMEALVCQHCVCVMSDLTSLLSMTSSSSACRACEASRVRHDRGRPTEAGPGAKHTRCGCGVCVCVCVCVCVGVCDSSQGVVMHATGVLERCVCDHGYVSQYSL